MGIFDDPESLSQLGMIGGLLGARKGDNWGNMLMVAASQMDQRKQRALQEQMLKQQMEAHQMQMQQQKEAIARQQQEQGLAQQFMQPGMPAIPAPAEAQGGGPGQAAQQPNFNFPGYAQALAGIDPMRALQLQSTLGQMNAKEAFTLKPGEKRFQGDKVVAEGGTDSPRKPGELRHFDSGDKTYTQEWDGQKWVSLGTSPKFKPEGPDKPEKAPAGYRYGPDGNSLAFIPGGPADPKGGKATDTERTAAGYLQRMVSADAIMKPLEADAGKPGVRESILMRGGATGEMAANALPQLMGGRSPERQQYRQAQEDWVRAKLRKESGAVIADTEMAREISTYFPQVGDSPQVIAQKAQARKVAQQAMQTGAGPAVQAPGGWSVTRVN